MKNEKMMREASPIKLLITMGLPTIVVMIVQVLYNMADVFFIGQGGDPMQVAALSLSGPAFGVFQGVGTLFGAGGCTAIAMALGQGDREKARYFSSFCAWGSVITGVALVIAAFVFMDPLLAVMGANAETSEYARTYLSIVMLGVPFTVFGGGLGNAIRADGSSAKTMLIALAGTFTNILLDPLFISVFHMGIAGAAWATVIGNVVSSVLVYLHVKKSDCFSVSPRYFTLKKDVSLRVIGLGIPMAMGVVLGCVSGMFSNQLLVKYGNIAVAANGVAGKAGMLVGMMAMGVCMGMQPGISYAYGMGAASAAVSAVLGAGCLIFRDAFMTAFINDPQVLETGRFMMLTLVAAPIGGIYQLCSSYLQGTGKVSYATLTSLLSKGLVFVPVLFISEALGGFAGLVFAGAISDLISTAIGAALCLSWAKKSAGSINTPCALPETA